MQPCQIVDAKVREEHARKANNAKDGQLVAPPAPDHPRMKQCSVNQPSDE